MSKPDNVVYNSETNKYDVYLKPSATSVSAPVIKTTETIAWRNRSVNKINHKIKSRYLELKEEYEKMMMEFEYTNLILNSKFSFEPLLVKIYHLYKRDNGETFLSIIAPEECKFNPVGSFYLNSDQICKKI